MITRSDITGKSYRTEDVHFFRNHVQAAYYVAWGGLDVLVDLFVDGNNKWVFVFDKRTHAMFKERWGKVDLENETYRKKEYNLRVDNNG